MTIQPTAVWLLLVSRTYRCRNFHINPSSRLELYLQAQSVGLGGYLLSIFYAQHWARCSRQQQQQKKKNFKMCLYSQWASGLLTVSGMKPSETGNGGRVQWGDKCPIPLVIPLACWGFYVPSVFHFESQSLKDKEYICTMNGTGKLFWLFWSHQVPVCESIKCH